MVHIGHIVRDMAHRVLKSRRRFNRILLSWLNCLECVKQSIEGFVLLLFVAYLDSIGRRRYHFIHNLYLTIFLAIACD